MKSLISRTMMSAAIIGAGFAAGAAQAETKEINLYSYRQPFLIQPMLNEFTKQSGIKVNVVFAKKGLIFVL